MRRLEPEESPPPERRSSSAGTPAETSGTGEENEDGLTPAGSVGGADEGPAASDPAAGLTLRLKEDILGIDEAHIGAG